MMAGAVRPAVGSNAYWTVLQEIADDLVCAGRDPDDTSRSIKTAALIRLLNIGYGPRAVFDLCAVVALLVGRTWPDHGRDAQGKPDLTAFLTSAAASADSATSGAPRAIRNAPFAMTERPTRQHGQRAHELKRAVVEAVQVDPEHPNPRGAARHALAAHGQSVREATGIYGAICELLTHLALVAQKGTSGTAF
ncbi:hypothetical protein AR457_37705 [Streptomyces agglomeratus]|nr:hypothetical protein AR457_37705 [Streptomyces agglomeratus]